VPESALDFPGISQNVAGNICIYAVCQRSWKVLSFLCYLLPAGFSGPTSNGGYYMICGWGFAEAADYLGPQQCVTSLRLIDMHILVDMLLLQNHFFGLVQKQLLESLEVLWFFMWGLHTLFWDSFLFAILNIAKGSDD